MGKTVKKVVKSVSKAVFGSSKVKDDAYALQQAMLAEQQRAARLAAQRAQADLSVGDTAVVLEGAAADDASSDNPLKRKKGAGSLSDTLGLGGL